MVSQSTATNSVFYPSWLTAIARRNAETNAWAASILDKVVKAAQPWMHLSDDELWNSVFTPSLRRSWMVWSNGFCPQCTTGVPMYAWQINPFKHAWKVECPHCQTLFPTNDFESYYRSGINNQGLFDTALADKSLIFNSDHPAMDDPLHTFGVDNGDGYAQGGDRWWFIATYLIYGQWKQFIVAGIRSLAAAYCLTSNAAYAHKAIILLDRVADQYPLYDFKSQGVMYEGPAHAGYVSTWHDACEETREMALAYDQIRGAIAQDEHAVAFLNHKAILCGIPNKKTTPSDISSNIEERILKDALNNRWKIESNYPRTDIAIIVIRAILEWSQDQKPVNELLDAMMDRSTAVDGITGEKGLAAYASYTIQAVGLLLGMFARLNASFLPDMLQRHPRIKDMYRFHIDTWVFQRYYPQVGDTGEFAVPEPHYVALPFSTDQWIGSSSVFSLGPSTYTLLYQLYELTGDVAYLQVIWHENAQSSKLLPYDIFDADQSQLSARIEQGIAEYGATPRLTSVNKQEWHLALLRAGTQEDERVAWVSYDSGGRHSHANGLNLGLFAKGLDLIPDFGYPPVHKGGWGGDKFNWYLSSPAHNTVTVDGRNHAVGAGHTTLWGAGKQARAVRIDAADLIQHESLAGQTLRFERTTLMVDLSDSDSYLVDIFRVRGGRDHAWFMHSHFSELTTHGLTLHTGVPYEYSTEMRNYQTDPAPSHHWFADWKIIDRQKLLATPRDIHLRYTDLGSDATVSTLEGWVATGGFTTNDEVWIPRLMMRRRLTHETTPDLRSTFAGIIEPYENHSAIEQVLTLPLCAEDGSVYSGSHVAADVQLSNGGHDIIVALDTQHLTRKERRWSATQHTERMDASLESDAELAWVRFDNTGTPVYCAIWNGSTVSINGNKLIIGDLREFTEYDLRAQ